MSRKNQIAPDESKSSIIIFGIAVWALLGAILALMMMSEIDERTRPVGQPKPTPPPINNAGVEFQYGVDPIDPVFLVNEDLCAKPGNECEEPEIAKTYRVERKQVVRDLMGAGILTPTEARSIEPDLPPWPPKLLIYSTVGPLGMRSPLPTDIPTPAPTDTTLPTITPTAPPSPLPTYTHCAFNANGEHCVGKEPCEHDDSCEDPYGVDPEPVPPYVPPVQVSAPGTPLFFIAFGLGAAIALRKVN